MRVRRDPLVGHPREGVIYFCPDADVPLAATGLLRTPVLSKYAFTEEEAVLLEAHRAPDDWFGAACRMPNLTVVGDTDAPRPRSCNLFAGELAKCAPAPRGPQPNVGMTATLTEAVPLSRGRCIVLCGSHAVRDAVFAHLRPGGMIAGDGAMDRYGRYTQVHRQVGSSVEVDGGARVVRSDQLDQHVVASPSTVRSGEYDTVIVMPEVPFAFARCVCRRTRFLVVGVAHSPLGYVVD